MSFPRKKVKWSPSNQLEFLCIDWIECDETIYEEYSKEDYFNKDDDEGVTEKKKNIINFIPYLYLV